MVGQLAGRHSRNRSTWSSLMTSRFSLLALALAATACVSQSTRHDPAADSTAVVAAMDAYVAALRGNDAATVSALWTDDAVYAALQTPTIRGHAAMDSLVRSHLSTMRITEITVRTEETAVGGDLAVQWGSYSEVVQAQQGAPQPIRGRFMFVWRRQADGSWKVARGIGTDATGL